MYNIKKFMLQEKQLNKQQRDFMVGVILSIIFAVFVLFNHSPVETVPNNHFIGAIITAIAIIVFFLYCMTILWCFSPLQKIEQNSTPRLFSLLKKDKYILGAYFWITFFLLFSFTLTVDAMLFSNLQKNTLLALWIVGLGITIDVYHVLFKRLMSYLNPFDNVQLFTQMAFESIQNDKEIDLIESIDSLTEISIKSLNKLGPSLCSQSLQEMQSIVKQFLSASKSIGHIEADAASKQLGINDRISYTLFYVLDKVALINDEAVQKRFEQVSTTAITVLGKIAINCAKLDLTLVSSPVHFITRCAKVAMNKGMNEIGVKTTITLIEVSKAIIEEVDYTYGDLKDPFFSITNAMEEIAKDTFLRDKSINLKLIIQPFVDLKNLFKNPKVANHQDTPIILQNIDRVLNEYASLELVMRTIPPIPEVPEKT